MNLKELIKKNNEEFDEKLNNQQVVSEGGLFADVPEDYEPLDYDTDALLNFQNQSQHSLLNKILEYIEGEKMSVKEDGILKDSVRIHNQALQLIEEYITEALTK